MEPPQTPLTASWSNLAEYQRQLGGLHADVDDSLSEISHIANDLERNWDRLPLIIEEVLDFNWNLLGWEQVVRRVLEQSRVHKPMLADI